MGKNSAQTPPAKPSDRRPALIIGLVLMLCYSYYFYLGGNWNVESRLALMHAVVDRGTLQIDHYYFNQRMNRERTQDIALYRGHYYSDKAVGVAFLGVPFYWGVKSLFALAPPAQGWQWVMGNYLVNLFVTAFPSALAGVLFFILLGYFLPAGAPRIWLTLAYGLGTIAAPYATMIFGHQTAAALGFIAFFILFRLRRRGWSPGWALAAGLLAGYSLITDFLSALVVLGLVIYAGVTVFQRGKGVGAGICALLPFLAGLLPPLALQLWYNWAAFGSPLASAYHYEVLEKFRIGMSAGLMGITYPRLEALYQLTFGPYRGLFYGSPFLLFVIPGTWLWLRRPRPSGKKLPPPSPFAEFRLEGLLCAGLGLFALLINASYYLWGGGGIYGARFMIPALPFICLLARPAMDFAPTAFKALALLSIIFTGAVMITTPLVPENAANPLFGAVFRDIWRYGFVSHPNNYNLLMLLGVRNLLSLVFLLLLVGLLLLRLRVPAPARK